MRGFFGFVEADDGGLSNRIILMGPHRDDGVKLPSVCSCFSQSLVLYSICQSAAGPNSFGLLRRINCLSLNSESQTPFKRFKFRARRRFMNILVRPKSQSAESDVHLTRKASLRGVVRLAIVGLAVAIGAVISPMSASAAPMTCNQARSLSTIYMARGQVQFIFGDYGTAGYYFGMARGVVEAACQ
jgi:hypothetical protein